jgi:prolipoprotein diacylglyceryltransferase
MDVASIEGVQIGPVYLRFYSLAVILGGLAAAGLAHVEAKRRGEDVDQVFDMLFAGRRHRPPPPARRGDAG